MLLVVRWLGGGHGGPGLAGRNLGDAHWREPIKWNRSALAESRRHRVFCASMADVFDNEVAQAPRKRLWELVRHTPNLDWLILTKRIGNASKMLPRDWGSGYPNVWLIVSVDQSALRRDVPKLLAVPAIIPGVSIEPQLGPVRLGDFSAQVRWVVVVGVSAAD